MSCCAILSAWPWDAVLTAVAIRANHSNRNDRREPTIVQNTRVYVARLPSVAETSTFVVTHSDEALHLG